MFSQSEYTASISEDKSVGSSVITVSATDRDKPGTPNSQVRYTFTGGDNGNGSFYVEYAGGRSTSIVDCDKIDRFHD